MANLIVAFWQFANALKNHLNTEALSIILGKVSHSSGAFNMITTGLPKPAECLKDFIIKAVIFSWPGSVVGIATGYGLDGQGIESRWVRDFPHLSRPTLGSTQPPV